MTTGNPSVPATLTSTQDPAYGAMGNWWRDPEKSESDKHLEATRNLLAAREIEEEIQLRKMHGQTVTLEFRKPKDILRSVVAPYFSLDDVPPPIAKLAYDHARASGHDHSGVVMAALVGAASMIADQCRIAVRARSGWYESARLWGVLIGLPSDGKTPSINAATNHIVEMHVAGIKAWRDQWKDVDPKERPPKPALFTSDSTIPALEELLKESERGILLRTNEFATWIGMIDGTSRGDGANNRGNWLQLYDGGAKQSNRINRSDVLIPNWSACVLAACTPDGLREHMKHMPEDGLIHRFLPVIVHHPVDPDLDADAQDARALWAQWLEYLRTIGPGIILMSPEAEAMFEQERREVQKLAEASYEFAPSFAAMLGKHGGQLARVALTFHCLTDRLDARLSSDTMRRAIMFMRTARRHSFAMLDGILTTSPALSLARSLGRSICAEVGLLTTIGRTWMSDHCAEFKKAEDRTRREAVQMLQDADWLEEEAGSRYSGWPTKWRVHPGLWKFFGKHGEEWRKHREAVRAAIGLEEPDDWT